MRVYIDITESLYYLMDELYNVTYQRDPLIYTGFVFDELLIYSWGEQFRPCLKYHGSLKEYLDCLKIPTTLQDYIINTFKRQCITNLHKLPYNRIFNYDGEFGRNSKGIYYEFTINRNRKVDSKLPATRARLPAISNVATPVG